MRRDDFTGKASGELRQSGGGYLTFIPHRLPPEIQFSKELVGSISHSERALGELHALSGLVPNSLLLVRPFMSREAVLSSRIEGTQTQLDELLQADAESGSKESESRTNRSPRDSIAINDLREVQNYVRALQNGLERLKTLPLSLRLIREVHAILMQGVRGDEKTPGEFRRCPVMIGRPGQTFETARFVPADHLELDTLLQNFEHFLHQTEFPTVVVAAIMHYQFEAIHPFMDGNGRMGRLLISLLFHARGALAQPLLYLSAYFEKHDIEYRDHLLAVSQRGTWEAWVGFFARGVVEQSQDAIRRSRKLLDLQSVYRTRLQESSQSSTVLRLIDELFRSPIITIGDASQRLDVTHRAARMNVDKLVNAGILEEIPNPMRTKFFRATEILRLLNAPTIE